MRSNKGTIRFALAAVAVVAIALGTSCGGGSSSSKGKGKPKEIRLDPPVVILRGAADTVDVRVILVSTTGRKTDVTADPGTSLTSSDTAVATVAGGTTITPQSAGKATLNASHAGFTAQATVYSDFAPALAAGDFDVAAPPEAVKAGKKVTVPVLLEMGAAELGSYRLRVTYDPAHWDLLNVVGGPELDRPLALVTATDGEATWTDTYSPSLGQALDGTIEVARLVLRAIGAPGDESILAGDAIGVWTNDFPASPVGDPTPRPFVTGRRWMVIE